MIQWLGLSAFIAVGAGSIPGQGTGIPQDTRPNNKSNNNNNNNKILHLVGQGNKEL